MKRILTLALVAVSMIIAASSCSVLQSEMTQGSKTPATASEKAFEIAALIGQLESGVNTYSALAEKVKDGNKTAIAQATSMLPSINTVSKKLRALKPSMTPSDVSRYSTILSSLATAKYIVENARTN